MYYKPITCVWHFIFMWGLLGFCKGLYRDLKFWEQNSKTYPLPSVCGWHLLSLKAARYCKGVQKNLPTISVLPNVLFAIYRYYGYRQNRNCVGIWNEPVRCREQGIDISAGSVGWPYWNYPMFVVCNYCILWSVLFDLWNWYFKKSGHTETILCL